jgi:hypothetical protein
LKVEVYRAIEDGILKRAKVQTLLDDGLGSVVLLVEYVLRVLGQHSHASVEVGDLRVRQGLKMLLPQKILLVTNREERDWHHGGVSEATLK